MTVSNNEKQLYRIKWIKLREDFFNEDAIDYIMSQKDGANYIVLYQLLCIKSANQGGRLAYEINGNLIPYDVDKIQRMTKWFTSDTIMVALDIFKHLGMIEVCPDGIMSITGLPEMIGSEAANANAIRQRRFRERARQQALIQGQQSALNVQDNTTQSVTKNNASNVTGNVTENVTQGVTKNNEEYKNIRDRENKDIENNKNNKILRDRDIENDTQSPRSLENNNYFDIFLSLYPRTIDPKKVLYVKNAWDKVAAGREEEILAALEDHIAHNADWAHDDGKFIPAAENWLLREEFLKEPPADKNIQTDLNDPSRFLKGPYGSVVNY